VDPPIWRVYRAGVCGAWYTEAWQQRLNHNHGWVQADGAPSVIGSRTNQKPLPDAIYPQDNCAETAEAEMSPGPRRAHVCTSELDANSTKPTNHERCLIQRIPGYIRGRRFEAVMASPQYTTVHEMASL